MRASTIELRLLGPLELVREGRLVTLPPSRKARALLAYLAATGRSHGREHLCNLFWDGPADPRGALRSALSRLRPILDDTRGRRLVADAEQVSFEPHGAVVDLTTARDAATAPDSDIESLSDAVDRFRGEFLEGLDLSQCYRFDVWCTTERASARRLHATLLSTLIERLGHDPELALGHARTRLQLDPFDERFHLDVIRLLGELGRSEEALAQYESCRRILREERGASPSRELDAIRRRMVATSGAVPTAPRREERVTTPRRPPLVGRTAEREVLARMIESARTEGPTPMLLVIGEAGIGKTRLLDELDAMAREAGGESLTGRAFEAEMIRPYGAWIDALRGIPAREIPLALRPALSPILPELGSAPADAADRTRLFEAVSQLLAGRLTGRRPLAILLDDVQWIDDASAALLHFIIRRAAAPGLLLACASRRAELDDNPAAARLLRALRRECDVLQLELSPLDADETADLVRTLGPVVNPDEVFERSGGNPLFALEIARAGDVPETPVSRTIEELIDDRLERLDAGARDLLPWAAALGRAFTLATLARVVEQPDAALLPHIAELEKRGVVAPVGHRYDFIHDIVREVAYAQLSEPRRWLIHGRIAHALDSLDGPDDELAGEVAHHAALGGDHELAARACLAAARRALWAFAPAEASALSVRGVQHLSGLATEARLSLHLELLALSVYPGMKEHRVSDVEGQLARAIAEARAAGLRAQVQRGFQLIADVHYLDGDFGGALDRSLRAQEAGRTADPATVVRAIGDTARCLGILERDMPRAGRLAREAESLAVGVGYDGHELPQALGYVHHHAGELDEAVECFEQAAHRARTEHARWFECACLSRLVMIELERDRPTDALSRCGEFLAVARKLNEGSDAPFAEALEAVAQMRLDPTRARTSLDAALASLRRVDSRWMIAYVQNLAGRSELDTDRCDAARQRVAEALDAAEVANRRNEVAVARAHLARLALRANDRRGARAQLVALREKIDDPGTLSARARAAVDLAVRAIELTSSPAVAPGRPAD